LKKRCAAVLGSLLHNWQLPQFGHPRLWRRSGWLAARHRNHHQMATDAQQPSTACRQNHHLATPKGKRPRQTCSMDEHAGLLPTPASTATASGWKGCG
jgi:hypothetical protein